MDRRGLWWNVGPGTKERGDGTSQVDINLDLSFFGPVRVNTRIGNTDRAVFGRMGKSLKILTRRVDNLHGW